MAKPVISDRVIFEGSGAQRQFLLDVKQSSGGSWSQVASILDLNVRTITDWAREKYAMSYTAFELLTKKYPEIVIGNVRVKSWQEHLQKIGVIGGKTCYKLYGKVGGDPAYRQQRWRQWWEATGKYLPSSINNNPVPIRIPKLSRKLAEFVGIVLGDGGISQYQLMITLHRNDDREYFMYVASLVNNLFKVPIGVYHSKNAVADTIVVSRLELVRFCIDVLGLKLGDKVKQQVDLPDWVKARAEYRYACLRGLVDTDGSVFTHRYCVKGKVYSYKKLAFTSRSAPLLASAHGIMRDLGVNPRYGSNYDIRIDNRANVQKYFDLVGSHNPKHLKRYAQ